MGLERGITLCDGKGIEFSKGLRTMDLALMVPVIKNEIESVKTEWQNGSIISVLIVPIFMWLISRLLSFHRRKWSFEYLIRIVFGSVVPEEPDTTRQRLIFVGFLVGCLMFSSVIYSSINILSSDLEILIEENYFLLINNTDDVILQQILSKSVPLIFSEECGGPLVKIITEKFPSAPGATLLGAGVPYAKRFDQVLQRLIESGISTQWMKSYSMRKDGFAKIDNSCSSKHSESALVMQQMVFICVTGFGWSALIFIFESIIVWRKK
ncbi:uncharacterized protein LOC122509211 [Leptopilina heterotoma]|uniref:uncharacterized protein LOC122509211 n=1 Tax=Leptopilina heterotoma TaxID=63436 RepID=UPI001CA9EA75|nr:uncharacterized protein LOC122509211 [Leptopilina heterotoma]